MENWLVRGFSDGETFRARVVFADEPPALPPSALPSPIEPRPYRYPPARRADVVDDYHGTKVADPYRWLETPDAPETVRWVEAENALTRSYLDGPARDALKARLARLFDYPRISVPERRGERTFYFRNTGLQDQSVLFVRDGSGERVLLDPNTLSSDGTVALTLAAATRDGRLLAYAVSRSGSDRQEIQVRDVDTGRDLPDRVLWAKFTGISWTPAHEGFYYTRFPEPGSVPPGDENYFGKVYYHRLGRPSRERRARLRAPGGQGPLAFRLGDARRTLPGPGHRQGGERQGGDPRPRSARAGLGTRSPLHRIRPRRGLRRRGGRTLLLSYGRGSAARPGGGGGSGTGPDLARGGRARRKGQARRLWPSSTGRSWPFGCTTRAVASSSTTWTAAFSGRFPLPGLGTVTGLTGEPDDPEMFLGFTSYTQPATPYRWDFAAEALTRFEEASDGETPSGYEVQQVFCTSKDGTRVPLFLVHQRGLARDGRRPTLLYGYGGFNISLTPAYNPATRIWLERGGVLAVANLRGGGEYGEEWHEAGMLSRKQNVFDDFIAAAESLVATGWTRPDKLAIQGGSNGGLLVGAVMTQRPELFGAVVCQVPVADMLRYHRFTVGRFWMPEYGSSEDPEQFPFLYRYSPLHNVRDGTDYPATLVMTADTDDRVAPGMAKKFAARLQAATDGRRPDADPGRDEGRPRPRQAGLEADRGAGRRLPLPAPGARRGGLRSLPPSAASSCAGSCGCWSSPSSRAAGSNASGGAEGRAADVSASAAGAGAAAAFSAAFCRATRAASSSLPRWQFLYFFPEPQWQGSLRPSSFPVEPSKATPP